jgi:hypothetical protein
MRFNNVNSSSFLIKVSARATALRRPTKGLEQIDEVARQIETTQERGTEADMHRVRGELLTAVGDAVAAETRL